MTILSQRLRCGVVHDGTVLPVYVHVGATERLMIEAAEEIERQNNLLQSIKAKLSEIIVTEGVDKGLVLISHESTTHCNPEMKCQVYDNVNFLPLGDALIELWEICK